MIFQTKVKVDWEAIKSRKRKLAAYNNTKENRSRYNHEYRVGDKILIVSKNTVVTRKLLTRTEGPFEITKVFPNGTVRIKRGAYYEIINIRRIKPYNSRV